MFDSIFVTLTSFAINTITFLGYPGIYFLTLLESTLIPIPSEIVIPFSAFLATQGVFNIWLVIAVGTLGSLSGSWIAYAIGRFAEKKVIRKLIVRYGKFILLSEEEYDHARNLFKRHSLPIIFFSRMIPGLKVIISLPAGTAKVPFVKFSILTFLGSFIFTSLLAFVGFQLGENWLVLKPFFMKFDLIILTIAIILISTYIYYKFKKIN